MPERPPFLTSEWRWLVMLNFEVHPAVLLPHVPAGTELDSFHGQTHVSIVAFHYFDTRISGWSIPWHQSFAEVNLRFYVRRPLADGSSQRGVVFLKEVVPRRAVALVANWLYGESFATHPMRVTLNQTNRFARPQGEVCYQWKDHRRWNRVAATPVGDPEPLSPDSEAEFIAEHYWGYTRLNARETAEYEVRHPSWRVYDVSNVTFDCDIASVYGSKFLPFLSVPPTSAFLGEGSPVRVFPGTRLSRMIGR